MQQKITENAFEGQPIYVGIDVHLKSWKVTVMTDSILYKTFSTSAEVKKLYEYLNRNFPGADFHSVYEAGFSGFWLHRELTKLGVKSLVVNPADVPTTDKERRQKEDKRDSRKLAETLRSGYLKAIHIPTEKSQQDRSLLRARESVVRDLSRTKNRIKSLLYYYGINFWSDSTGKHWSKRFMMSLEKLDFSHATGKASLQVYLESAKQQRAILLRVNRQIRELSQTSDYKENVELLLTVPGIGIVSAMTFLMEIQDINRFTDLTKLCSYIGLIPSTDSSGDTAIVKGITPRKNLRLRSIIVESSWVAIRHDPALMLAYEKLTKRMHGNRAIIRIARKLLNRIVYVLRHKQPYTKGVIV